MYMHLMLPQEDYKERLKKKIWRTKIYTLLKELYRLRPSQILRICMRHCLFRGVGKERKEIIQFSCLLLRKLSLIDLFFAAVYLTYNSICIQIVISSPSLLMSPWRSPDRLTTSTAELQNDHWSNSRLQMELKVIVWPVNMKDRPHSGRLPNNLSGWHWRKHRGK